jgi:uncharacterized protein (TIGR00730 family)
LSSVSVCVFCASNTGVDPRFADAARELGEWLAQNQIGLVYGGGRVGLMGILADACLAARGRVVGVIPRSLVERELAHSGLSELRVVSSMHERKAVMADLSSAFVALPGGMGTFDELFEIITWAQLGFHAKPICIVNTAGYFDPLIAMVGHAHASGFVAPQHRELLKVAPTVSRVPETLWPSGFP